ncbi:MAG: ATP-binding protein [Bacteroidales bacterium]|jgi:signal transduction histidine kinase|nr:ATP-binding protein [Bacteroidales bacterium]MDD3299278.1 ATP-binding protein [Bacteroidales bacterium]MDD3843169.1 ATP-binding protein [Bacteroidales bacterium]MDD4617947.1 ATP-binding protein [Bacteroidales bacterium]
MEKEKHQGYIMALEDSLVQAKRLEYFFRKNHLDYKIFATAEEALEQVLEEIPLLIISDIIMPGMDGYQFCKKVKSNPLTNNVPVILLTSLQDPNDIIRGLQAGANNFITKPYDETYLLSRIEQLLDNKRYSAVGECDTGCDPISLKYRGEEFSITSGRKQILDLLLSVYDTAIQRNEELIEIKERLESTNKELTQANEDLDAFARTVSHDLKSPLTVILGFSSAILDNAQSNVSQEEKSYIEFMRESALEMNQLIKDLLSFSQSGRINLEKEEVDLSQIANDMIDSILLRFPGTSPQITIEPNMKVFADPRMMRVVLDNLLGNAVKYSSKNSSPQITFAKREYYGKELFYVKDNGVGFDMSKADKLFQPFVRLHSQSDYSGTGVGLSTVKRIIDKHSGEIWAESEPGKGTEFLFFLG